MGLCVLRFSRALVTPQLLGRRLRLEQGRTVCPIAPAFVMPAMTGRTQDVDHAVFLRRLHVPRWAIAHVFGHDALSGYRLEHGLSRFSLVGTPVKPPEQCPKALVAEATQRWLQGERVDSATNRRARRSLGSVRGPVSLPESLGQSVWRVCQRSAGLGGRVGAGDGQDRWLASHARRLEGPVHPHHGDPVFAPCVSHHPCSRPQHPGRHVCAGPKAGGAGGSRPEQTGCFPASAAREGMGPDGTA